MNYRISLSAICVPLKAHDYITHVLVSEDIGQQSPYLARFEQMLCDYTGAQFAIATGNGTTADAIAIAALKLKYNPRRVIVPALTFIAQANAVYYNGLDIEFCDVREDFTLDWGKVYENPLSIYFPSDCLGRVADPHTLRVVEDACEAFGSRYGANKAGRNGELGTFSFFVTHTISTGEGGAIITDDEYLAMICRSLRSHGRASDMNAMDKFVFPRLGFNGKLTALQAALGCAVMEQVDTLIETRRTNYRLMQDELQGFAEREGEQIVPHGFPVEFRSEMTRDEALRNLLAAGIECRKLFSCLPTMEGAYSFKHEPLGRYPVAEHIAHTHLYVPCHQNMTPEDTLYVIDQVRQQAGRVRAQIEYSPRVQKAEYVLNA